MRFFYRKNNYGFTLIELLVVMSIIVILAGIGINGIGRFTRGVAVDNASKDFASALLTAKSRAFSNVKPSGCTVNLTGYVVNIPDTTHYSLVASCDSASKTFFTRTLVSGMTVARSNNTTSVTFPLLTGNVVFNPVATSATFTFTKDSTSRVVTVYDDGRVIAQ